MFIHEKMTENHFVAWEHKSPEKFSFSLRKPISLRNSQYKSRKTIFNGIGECQKGGLSKRGPCVKKGATPSFFKWISTGRLKELNQVKESVLTISGSSYPSFLVGLRLSQSHFQTIIQSNKFRISSTSKAAKYRHKFDSTSVGDRPRRSYESSLKSPKRALSRGWVRLAAQLIFSWKKVGGPLFDTWPPFWEAPFLTFPYMVFYYFLTCASSTFSNWVTCFARFRYGMFKHQLTFSYMIFDHFYTCASSIF